MLPIYSPRCTVCVLVLIHQCHPQVKKCIIDVNVPPLTVLEPVVCVQIDGQTQIPRVTLQSSQSNKCCSLNNSGLNLHCGLRCWENTTHIYGCRAGGHIPDRGTIKEWEEMTGKEKEPSVLGQLVVGRCSWWSISSKNDSFLLLTLRIFLPH